MYPPIYMRACIHEQNVNNAVHKGKEEEGVSKREEASRSGRVMRKGREETDSEAGASMYLQIIGKLFDSFLVKLKPVF